MPVISNLSASNSSFIVQYGNYTDFNIWVLILAASLILMLASRYIPIRDEAGRFLISVLAFLLAVSSIWMSLGIANLQYTSGASIVANNTSLNQTITYNYIYPMQQVLASPALTVICIILTVLTFLNALDIFIVVMQKSPEQDNKGGFKI
jgi:hypothetical protein